MGSTLLIIKIGLENGAGSFKQQKRVLLEKLKFI
jgi:hypothetical protein